MKQKRYWLYLGRGSGVWLAAKIGEYDSLEEAVRGNEHKERYVIDKVRGVVVWRFCIESIYSLNLSYLVELSVGTVIQRRFVLYESFIKTLEDAVNVASLYEASFLNLLQHPNTSMTKTDEELVFKGSPNSEFKNVVLTVSVVPRIETAHL